MKKLDEQIKRIKELMSEETLYGKNIDLITESMVRVRNLLVDLFTDAEDSLEKLKGSSAFESNKYMASEWKKNIDDAFALMKTSNKLPINPEKTSDLSTVLIKNKKIISDMREYIKNLEFNRSSASADDLGNFDLVDVKLSEMEEFAEKAIDILTRKINIGDEDKKYIQKYTNYKDDVINKMLKNKSIKTRKYINKTIFNGKRLFNATLKWYTEDQASLVMKMLQTATPFNIRYAAKGGGAAAVVKTFILLYLQAALYGRIYKAIRCDLFGDEETETKIKSFGPKAESLWEKHKVNNLDTLIKSFGANPLIMTQLTAGWYTAVLGDCEPIDDRLLQKMVDDGLLSQEDAESASVMGKSYMEKLGLNKYLKSLGDDIKFVNKSIQNMGEGEFNDNFGDSSYSSKSNNEDD